MEERYIKVDSFLNGLFELSSTLSEGLETIEFCINLNVNCQSPITEDHLFAAYHSIEKALVEVEHEIARHVGKKIAQTGHK